MAVHFNGMKPDSGEIIPIGTLLMHPHGQAMIMGPDPEREISFEVVMRCMEAAHHMCIQLPADAPQEEKVLRFAVRSVVFQLLASLLPPDELWDDCNPETLQ